MSDLQDSERPIPNIEKPSQYEHQCLHQASILGKILQYNALLDNTMGSRWGVPQGSIGMVINSP